MASLLLAGCAVTDTEPTRKPRPQATQPQSTTQPQAVDYDGSLVSLRQTLIGTPQCFAAAYFGYAGQGDPLTFLAEAAPQLCQDLPFLLQIPNIVGSRGHLFCVLPADEQATVAVNLRPWDEATQSYGSAKLLYRSESGEPFLLLTENDPQHTETEVIITDSQGQVTVWYPWVEGDGRIAPSADEDGASLYQDFSPYEHLNYDAISEELAGSWVLTYTEAEGDRVAADHSRLEITARDGSLLLTYRDSLSPELDFADATLLLRPGALYPDCGNSQWFAQATPDGPITYSLTLLPDGTLLMQYSFELDGSPMVTYGWYAPAP